MVVELKGWIDVLFWLFCMNEGLENTELCKLFLLLNLSLSCQLYLWIVRVEHLPIFS